MLQLPCAEQRSRYDRGHGHDRAFLHHRGYDHGHGRDYGHGCGRDGRPRHRPNYKTHEQEA